MTGWLSGEALHIVIWPDASSAKKSIAAVSALLGMVRNLILRFNSSRRSSWGGGWTWIAFDPPINFHRLCERLRSSKQIAHLRCFHGTRDRNRLDDHLRLG